MPSANILTMMIFVCVGVGVGLLGTGMRLGIEKLEAWRLSLIFEECEAKEPYNATSACTRPLKEGLTSGGVLAFALPSVIVILNMKWYRI